MVRHLGCETSPCGLYPLWDAEGEGEAEGGGDAKGGGDAERARDGWDVGFGVSFGVVFAVAFARSRYAKQTSVQFVAGADSRSHSCETRTHVSGDTSGG